MHENLPLIIICVVITTSCNNSTNNIKNKLSDQQKETIVMKDTTPKVTGIGGIFFRSRNPEQTKEWYGKILGFAINQFGVHLMKPQIISILQRKNS